MHEPKTNARLQKYLVEDTSEEHITSMDDAKQYLKKSCYVNYIVEDDTVQRGKISHIGSTAIQGMWTKDYESSKLEL